MAVLDRATVGGGVISLIAAGALQYFTITIPEMKRADANRDRNFHASDLLKECSEERIQHNRAYHPPEHPH